MNTAHELKLFNYSKIILNAFSQLSINLSWYLITFHGT